MENESILEQIFNSRVDELANLTEEDRQLLEGKKDKVSFDESFKDESEEKKGKIAKFIEVEMENMSAEMGHFCEKYYKNGFADGIKLFTECLKK